MEGAAPSNHFIAFIKKIFNFREDFLKIFYLKP